MVLKTVSVSLVVDSCISTSTNQHHSIGRVGRMVGTGRRNSRTGGIREPEEMGLEGESWSKSWLWVGVWERSVLDSFLFQLTGGRRGVTVSPHHLPYSFPFWQNAVNTPLTVTNPKDRPSQGA